MTTIYDYIKELDECRETVSPLVYVALNCAR